MSALLKFVILDRGKERAMKKMQSYSDDGRRTEHRWWDFGEKFENLETERMNDVIPDQVKVKMENFNSHSQIRTPVTVKNFENL